MQQQAEITLSIETTGKRAGELVIGMPRVYNDRIEKLPGAHYLTVTDRWTIPLTWNSLLSLSELAKEIQWSIAPTPEVQAFAAVQHRAWADLTKAARVVRKKKEKEDGWFCHQVDGAHWLNAAPGTGVGRLLQDSTGIGKTGTVIKAIMDSRGEGPVLVTSPESVMKTGWVHDLQTFAPKLRVVQIVGNITQRRKLIQAVKEGQYDVAVIGHSTLKAHTRFEAYGNHGLKKCIACGGPRLTSDRRDENGVAIPDITSHKEVILEPDYNDHWTAVCQGSGCDWHGDTRADHDQAEEQAEEHRAKKDTVTKELTAAQCQRHMKELNEIQWSRLVVDEVHRAMSALSQFTQAIWGVANYSGTGIPPERRIGLSATIISKRSEQAWAPLHFIGPDNWPTKSAWVDYFCVEEFNWAGFREIRRIKPERLDEFQRTYSAVSRRVLKEQVLDLPPVMRWGGLERELELGGKQKAAYVQMRDKMLLVVERGLITVDNAANQAGRLSMLASGTGYPDPGNRPGGPQKMLLDTPSVKLDQVIADFRSGEFDDHQVGMMFNSAQALRLFRSKMIEAKVATTQDFSVIIGGQSKQEQDLAIEGFQAGKRRIAMFTYAAGAVGITLTAADYVLAVERSWNPIHNVQGVNRFHRIGSERHQCITVIDYVVRGTNEIKQLTRMGEDAEALEQVVQDRARLASWFE